MHTDPAEPLRTAFRDVMAGVATPVSVVTTVAGGHPHGTTVSAFASLSMDPPMVLVALDRGSELLARLGSSGRFGLNVLGSTQAELARAFARKGGAAKFTGCQWSLHHGLPRLAGAPGWLPCEVAGTVDGGDHVVVLGRVLAAERCGGRPLTYSGRAFGTHELLLEPGAVAR